MHKKLISLAVAAAFAAPAAMAEVAVYGKVHMDIVSTDSPTEENIEVTSNASRLGFKGSEDLGNGLKAIFKYEMTYSGVDNTDANNDGVDDNTSIDGARNSYIGLSGSFGTFLIGRHDTPAKSAYYASGNDHLGDSIIDLNNIGFTERRVPNAIAYVSPNFSGVRIAAAIVPGEQDGQGDNDENGLMDSYSLGVMYKGHGVKAGLGYETIGDTSAGADNNDTTTLHIGASYTFMNNYTVGVQYGTDDNINNVDGDERTTFALAGKAKFGNNAIVVNFGDTETESNTAANNSEATHMGIGFHHTMSKRTSAYVAYKNVDPDGGDSTDQLAVGMIHKF
jgi:predicted porin